MSVKNFFLQKLLGNLSILCFKLQGKEFLTLVSEMRSYLKKSRSIKFDTGKVHIILFMHVMHLQHKRQLKCHREHGATSQPCGIEQLIFSQFQNGCQAKQS